MARFPLAARAVSVPPLTAPMPRDGQEARYDTNEFIDETFVAFGGHADKFTP
jgi:hypothetical protein